MKNNLIRTLSNGLTVVFPELNFTRHAFGSVTLDSFTVTLGGMLTLSDCEASDVLPTAVYSGSFAEVFSIARELAEIEAREEAREFAELREWLNVRR